MRSELRVSAASCCAVTMPEQDPVVEEGSVTSDVSHLITIAANTYRTVAGYIFKFSAAMNH